MSHRFRLFLVSLGAMAFAMQGATVHAAYNSPWRTDTLLFKGKKSKAASSSSSSGSSDSSDSGSSSSSSSPPAAAASTPPPPPVNPQALAALKQLYDKLEKEWEATPDAAALIQDQKNAQEAYDAAAQKVTDELAKSPDYQAAVAHRKQLSEHLEQLKATTPGARTDIDTATDDLMTASLALHQMETDALSTDKDVRQAKVVLVQAQLAVAAAKDVWEKSLSQNSEYAAAKQAAGQSTP